MKIDLQASIFVYEAVDNHWKDKDGQEHFGKKLLLKSNNSVGEFGVPVEVAAMVKPMKENLFNCEYDTTWKSFRILNVAAVEK